MAPGYSIKIDYVIDQLDFQFNQSIININFKKF